MANKNSIKVGIVGTGYIADFHARAIQARRDVELASVVDTNPESARSFATRHGIGGVHATLEASLRDDKLGAVHVLVPPDAHFAVTEQCLNAGASVFLEKPMTVTSQEAGALLDLAARSGLSVGVNHNMMFFEAYRRLREIVRNGTLGPIDHININWFSELGQVRFGPFDTWMLRTPTNVALETGPHLVSVLLDLVGPLENITTVADREIEIPGGRRVRRRWRMTAQCGRTSISLQMNFAPTFAERTISVHGVTGTAVADLNANVCLTDVRGPSDPDFDRFGRSRSLAAQLRSQSWQTLGNYLLARAKLRRGGNPFEASFHESIGAFYTSLVDRTPLDRRIDGEFGKQVIATCEAMIAASEVEHAVQDRAPPPLRAAVADKPSVLVLGGSGFIGKELIRQLVAKDYTVRAMLRGKSADLEAIDGRKLELVRGDIRSPDDLRAAMDGIRFVYDLAVGKSKSWDEYRRNEVDTAELIGKLCLEKGIERLVYTGTIDSYYAGAKAGTITEATPLDPNIHRRNYYARAKAAAEGALLQLHKDRGLPLVILRPGIVIGRGGSPFHWGVGRFTENVCEVWGKGDNLLPFVLVADVAAALVLSIEAPGLEGRSFNLIDEPLISGRDYLAELERRAGIKLSIHFPPIARFYLADLAKWMIKVLVKHPDRIRVPSYADWESRTQRAHFDCTTARTALNWSPASDREKMLTAGIQDALEDWLAAVR